MGKIYRNGKTITPSNLVYTSGTINIARNGTYNVAKYAQAEVSLPQIENYGTPTILVMNLPANTTVPLQFSSQEYLHIDWGDGTLFNGKPQKDKTIYFTSHTYADAGRYTIKIFNEGITTLYSSKNMRLRGLGGASAFSHTNIFGETSSSLTVSNYLNNAKIGNVFIARNYAFANCRNARIDISEMGNIATNIADSKAIISMQAFAGCGMITDRNSGLPFQLSNVIYKISTNAFSKTNITELMIPPTMANVISLENINALPSTITKILVPASILGSYANSTNWANFADKMVGY